MGYRENHQAEVQADQWIGVFLHDQGGKSPDVFYAALRSLTELLRSWSVVANKGSSGKKECKDWLACRTTHENQYIIPGKHTGIYNAQKSPGNFNFHSLRIYKSSPIWGEGNPIKLAFPIRRLTVYSVKMEHWPPHFLFSELCAHLVNFPTGRVPSVPRMVASSN